MFPDTGVECSLTGAPDETPRTNHPVTIESNPGRVVVTFAGREVANTTRALTMKETTYPAVHYIPREDVDMSAA